jgi:Zn-dependent peptidase ImmA (M78 family)
MQSEWRTRIEACGVVVLFLPLGRDSVRGFSMYDNTAPLLAINTHWGYRPRVFSMLHEFVHLASRTSSACVETFHRFPNDDDRLERWCEEVAAGILMPWSEVESFLSTALHLRAADQVKTLDDLYRISNNFQTSARATALRLIGRQRAEWSLYKEIPAAKEEKAGGGGGGGRTRPEIREDEYGARTIRVFAQATERGLLSRTDAAGYLKMSDADIDAWR